MNHYVTGNTIKSLREKRNLTQSQLADQLQVSNKTISKWETGRGLPDISLLEPLASALQVSVPELLSGDLMTNQNRGSNMMRSKIYVCPVCGNVFHSVGTAMISCCGITLPALEAEEADDAHQVQVETIEDEYFVTTTHPMEKTHSISFVAYCTGSRFELVKLYPESNMEVRFMKRGSGMLYWYCNHHGLFCQKLSRR